MLAQKKQKCLVGIEANTIVYSLYETVFPTLTFNGKGSVIHQKSHYPTFLAPHFHKFSIVVQIMHESWCYFGQIDIKFCANLTLF